MHAEILARIDFALSFDDKVNSGPSELADELTKKLDAQEALMRETREEMSLIKEWLKMGAPDTRGKTAADLLNKAEGEPSDPGDGIATGVGGA